MIMSANKLSSSLDLDLGWAIPSYQSKERQGIQVEALALP
jgi:hypothetical protein